MHFKSFCFFSFLFYRVLLYNFILERALWTFVSDTSKKKQKRIYRTYSEITNLVTVFPAAYIMPVSRGSLPFMAPEL